MPATPSGNKVSSSTLFAFTPRQVLLNRKTMKHDSSNGTPDAKILLHQSIARYLDHAGFSKTLKKFRSEAQIQIDTLEGSLVDLEEMCLKYIETCGKDAKSSVNDQKEQEDGKSKDKKKKKSKLVSVSLDSNVEDNQLKSQTGDTVKKVRDDVSADAKVVNGAETEKKSKDKKKKKNKLSSQGDAIEHIGDPKETVLENENLKTSNEDVTDEKKKDTKKRKRPTSEENDQQVADKKEAEEPKRRKLENLNKSKGGEESAMKNDNLGNALKSNKENIAASGQDGGDQPQKTPNRQSNGHLGTAEEKSSVLRSQKKQQKESAETSAKKAFQRVQMEKVEFADERLQDNSYWAKDGAETGYGAKAQEILGQVRGRDFRHEKTKKKRGTYRGGHIDLQSHSVKFNYSDEE